MRKRDIRQLVDSTADPAFAVNGLHNIEFWNRAAEEFFGITSEETVGKPCNTVIQGYDECGEFCSKDCSILESSKNHKRVGNFDLQIQTTEGRKWCNVSILTADDDKSIAPYTIHIIKPADVTKRLEVLLRDFVVNETNIPPEQAASMISSTRSPVVETNLTGRELEVLRLLAKGKTTASVAEELFISRTTVNNHVQHILKKLNAHTRLEAIRRAEHSGLI